MDEKISIPKLRVISYKDPTLVPFPQEEPPTHLQDIKQYHQEINNAYELLIADPEVETVECLSFMWSPTDPDRIAVTFLVDHFAPKFLLPDFIADAVRNTLADRRKISTIEDEEEY